MTHENRRKPAIVVGAALLAVCGAYVHAQENPATTQKAPDNGRYHRWAGRIAV